MELLLLLLTTTKGPVYLNQRDDFFILHVVDLDSLVPTRPGREPPSPFDQGDTALFFAQNVFVIAVEERLLPKRYIVIAYLIGYMGLVERKASHGLTLEKDSYFQS